MEPYDPLAQRAELVPLGPLRLALMVIELRERVKELEHDLWWERTGKHGSYSFIIGPPGGTQIGSSE